MAKTRTVFVAVVVYDYDPWQIIGVFDSRKDAESYKAKCPNFLPIEVQAWTLNKPRSIEGL